MISWQGEREFVAFMMADGWLMAEICELFWVDAVAARGVCVLAVVCWKSVVYRPDRDAYLHDSQGALKEVKEFLYLSAARGYASKQASELGASITADGAVSTSTPSHGAI